ncbi:DNA-binding transcriptional regulator, AcrR family [Micromonospora phaseoli]|uniref:DNA-binding transcriptional regulator, AcrR family n=1 Tax=Micromonospora phaseoli TaxID=1144548 RepID=A0A1H6RY02_9ACTN|nr:TetR family transcriptional regulator [Micromonospora phaseoli]SEI60643.1 DNA-binding transcriptional regulator, AcrR family [Micromonospora phaseoli]
MLGNCPASDCRKLDLPRFGDGPCPFRWATVTDVTRRAAEIRLDALLRTACDVIAQRGLANTRTADVAQAAGVSQALVFYHFATKERLLAQAFAYAVEQDLARLDAVTRSNAPPLTKLRRILRLYTPAGRPTSWSMWIDGWSESLRTPELEKVSRKLDLRWRQDLATVISDGVREGIFDCADPAGAAWRISAVMDGLAVQLAVHDRVISRRQFTDWVRLVTARELGLEPAQLE